MILFLAFFKDWICGTVLGYLKINGCACKICFVLIVIAFLVQYKNNLRCGISWMDSASTRYRVQIDMPLR